jgi:hypothetical protein
LANEPLQTLWARPASGRHGHMTRRDSPVLQLRQISLSFTTGPGNKPGRTSASSRQRPLRRAPLHATGLTSLYARHGLRDQPWRGR